MGIGPSSLIVISDVHMNDDQANAEYYRWLPQDQGFALTGVLNLMAAKRYEVSVKQVMVQG